MLAVLLASVLWGTTGTVAQQAPEGSSQLLVGLSTFGFGGLMLVALDRRAAVRVIGDRDLAPMVVAGAVGVLMYASMYYVAMSLVGVAVGNVLALGSGPVFAVLLELVVDRRPVLGGWVVATAVTIAGVACLAGDAGSAPGSEPLLGVLLALGAGFGYALYAWSGARMIVRGHPSRAVMAAMFGLASLGLLPAFLLGGPGPLLQQQGLLVLVYLALVPMAFAYLAFGYGLRRLRASTATTLALSEPVVATLLALAVLGERLGVVSWVGMALIVAGIVLVALVERQQERPRPEWHPGSGAGAD
jgi:drug/metabolite transporter, DME family